MGGKMSRDKGKRGEYEARDFLKRWFPLACRGANQSRSGNDAADIEGTPFWVEAKLGAKPNVRAALAQAQEATNGRPVLVYVRDDKSKPFFVLDAESMEYLLRRAFGEVI
jgi:hypothetical protein